MGSALSVLAPPPMLSSPPTPPAKNLILQGIELFETSDKFFKWSTGIFGFGSFALTDVAACCIYSTLKKAAAKSYKFLYFVIFVGALFSSFCNAYVVLLPEKPGLIEFMALIDIANAIATLVLTASQQVDAKRKGNGFGGAFRAALLAGGVFVARVLLLVLMVLLKEKRVQIYTTAAATLISTLSAFVPAFTDPIKEYGGKENPYQRVQDQAEIELTGEPSERATAPMLPKEG